MAATETLAEQHARAAAYILIDVRGIPRNLAAVRLANLPDLPSASPCMAEGGPADPN